MFKDDLNAALKADHMTQTELAKYLDVAQTSVSLWVRGKTQPKQRAFNMICDLFGFSREKYTAERNGIEPVEFHPKPILDPKVKEKESEWKNPYVKPEKDKYKELKDEIAELKKNQENLKTELIRDMDTIASEIVKKDKDIAELNEKIIYLLGMVDAKSSDEAEREKPSWWKRLWG